MQWRGKLFISLAIALSVGSLLLLTRSREPSFEGRTLTEWLQIHVQGGSADATTNRAAEAVRQIGTNALPMLMNWVREDRLTLGDNLEGIWLRLPSPLGPSPSTIKTSPRPTRKVVRARQVLRAFRLLEQSGYPAIPELKWLMKNTNDLVWQKANLALATMSGEGLRALAEGLPEPNAPQARVKVENIAFRLASFKGSHSLPADDKWQRNYITNTVRELLSGNLTNAAPK